MALVKRIVLLLAASMLLASIVAGYSNQDGETAAAANIFMQSCKDCHGADGRGGLPGQPDFRNRDWQTSVTDERLFKVIKFGKEPMPFFYGALTDAEITALVKYIRSLASSDTTRRSDANANDESHASAPSQQTNNCVECHRKQSDGIVSLYSESVHARASISCSRCHGGEPAASDKQAAHAALFTGKPSRKETIAMCGSCHATEREAFMSGLHFQKAINEARLDCAECHGAHTVGARESSFSFVTFCAGCHGLEYIPELPKDFQKLLAAADDDMEVFRKLKTVGRAPNDELMARHKELSRAIGDIVHRTDLHGGIEKLPQILKLADESRRSAEQEK
ncbi:MAG TPA: c-type cytochrome [Blastocatellia bacterium]|nr:c-type cytochrome [Blastocatellia bacterium]